MLLRRLQPRLGILSINANRGVVDGGLCSAQASIQNCTAQSGGIQMRINRNEEVVAIHLGSRA